MKAYGFGYNASFPDIEKYLCVLLRNQAKYHIDNFLPENLHLDKTYVLVLDTGRNETQILSANQGVSISVIGPNSDRHYTHTKGVAEELILAIKEDTLKASSPITNVEAFGPTRITNSTRPEILVSFEIELLGT